MIKRNIKVVLLLMIAVMCLLSGCGKKTGETGVSDSPQVTAGNPSATDGAVSAVPEVTIDEAVPEDVKQNIDFDAYENQNAYELAEKETETQTKLIYPVNTFQTDKLDVKYHVDLVTKDNGAVVLEVLGTDFNITKKVSVIKVEWKSVGLKVMPTEKVYEFKGLCIILDDEVYFYEDVFYSPFIQGREITYKQISN